MHLESTCHDYRGHKLVTTYNHHTRLYSAALDGRQLRIGKNYTERVAIAAATLEADKLLRNPQLYSA
jgi:hypothetical protein